MKIIGKLGLMAVLAAVAVALGGCGDNAKDCYEKGDAKACQAVCETGKQDAIPACYEIRARETLACVDGKGDCAKACANWKNAKASADTIKQHLHRQARHRREGRGTRGEVQVARR